MQKDKVVLKKLQKGVESRRPHEAQSALLRRYFRDLTNKFIIPLESYLASHMPFQRDISPYRGTPVIPPFNADDFLKTLENVGPHLKTGIKGDWAGLYQKFFKSTNFSAWYESRSREVNQVLKVKHIEAISKTDLARGIQDKAEIEVVDLILTMKEKLKTVENENLPVDKDCIGRLQSQLDHIIDSLPQDLHDILRR